MFWPKMILKIDCIIVTNWNLPKSLTHTLRSKYITITVFVLNITPDHKLSACSKHLSTPQVFIDTRPPTTPFQPHITCFKASHRRANGAASAAFVVTRQIYAHTHRGDEISNAFATTYNNPRGGDEKPNVFARSRIYNSTCSGHESSGVCLRDACHVQYSTPCDVVRGKMPSRSPTCVSVTRAQKLRFTQRSKREGAPSLALSTQRYVPFQWNSHV